MTCFHGFLESAGWDIANRVFDMAQQIVKHELAVPNTVLFALSVGEVGHKAFVGNNERIWESSRKNAKRGLAATEDIVPLPPSWAFLLGRLDLLGITSKVSLNFWLFSTCLSVSPSFLLVTP